jgi:hypothetical protein
MDRIAKASHQNRSGSRRGAKEEDGLIISKAKMLTKREFWTEDLYARPPTSNSMRNNKQHDNSIFTRSVVSY